MEINQKSFLLPETKRSNCDNYKNEITNKCRKIFGIVAISNEMLNDFGYSWFLMKYILVQYSFVKIKQIFYLKIIYQIIKRFNRK